MTPVIPGDDDRIGRLVPFLAAAFTFAVFLPALGNGFVNWDDFANLLQNPHYRGLGPEQLKWMFTTFHMGPYQPLSWLTLGLDYKIWGMNPFGYHLTNVVLHSLNSLVFCFLCEKLLALAIRPSFPEKGTELFLAAGFAAVLFSVHPLRVESVAWVTERRDVLSGFFYLLAVFWYVAARAGTGEKVPFWRRQLLPLAAFLFSLLSKGMAVSLPVTLLVLDVYPLRRLPGVPARWFSSEARGIWLEKVPFFVLAVVFGVIGYMGQAKTGALATYQHFGPGQRAAAALFSAGFYIWETLLPLHLSPFHKITNGASFMSWPPLLAGAVVMALTAAAVDARRNRPAWLSAWTCYLAALAPVAGIVKFGAQSSADRYTYLPCLGFAVLAGAGFLALRRTSKPLWKKTGSLLACLLVLGLAGLTWSQEKIWYDSETLWNHALAVNPGSDFAHNDLGLALADRGEFDLALWHYREALRINPANAHAHNNLAILLNHQGKAGEAVGQYLEALKLNPGDPETRYNLACALAGSGRTDEAIEQLREALKTAPDFAQAHNDLGTLLASKGRTDEALEHFLKAIKIRPDFAQAHHNLSLIMAGRVYLEKDAGRRAAPKDAGHIFTPRP